jgi:putative lipoprotein (rSAM/lipoprotein system)
MESERLWWINKNRLDMKNNSLKFFDKLIMALMGLFPFYTACDDEPREMYGTPTADYLIMGTVTDSLTNTPVQHIRVSIKDSVEPFIPSDTVYTDAAGKYSFSFQLFPYGSVPFKLKIEDIDGESNGGPYLTEEGITEVAATSLDKSKAKGWYSGKITAVKNFKLNK